MLPRLTPNSNSPRGTPPLNFFEDGSPFLSHPLLTPDRTQDEVDGLLRMSRLASGTRWLDIGCGFGRHAVELASRGYDVVGIDASSAMIAAGRRRAAAAQVEVDLKVAFAEEYVPENPFDAAICLFTSLGQITPRGENTDLVTRAFTALKPGGQLIIELHQRETAVAALNPVEEFGHGENQTTIKRRYHPENHVITEIFEVTSQRQTRSFYLAYRLYSHDEVGQMLTTAGFMVKGSYQDFAQMPLKKDALRMVILGQKPGES